MKQIEPCQVNKHDVLGTFNIRLDEGKRQDVPVCQTGNETRVIYYDWLS